MKKLTLGLLIGIIGLILLIAGCSSNSKKEGAPTVILYKSEMCGCCGLYGQYLEQNEYNVEIKDMPDISPIKDQYSIPSTLRSCHTLIVDGYYVEGHIPKEAINKLLSEKPSIAGIAMPGMPSGSPGMPGAKKEPFVIYAVAKDGNISEFMRI